MGIAKGTIRGPYKKNGLKRTTAGILELPQFEGLILLYHWRRATEFLITQYGQIRYIDWLEREKARILKKNADRTAEVKIAGKGTDARASLWVDDVAGVVQNMGVCVSCNKLKPLVTDDFICPGCFKKTGAEYVTE